MPMWIRIRRRQLHRFAQRFFGLIKIARLFQRAAKLPRIEVRKPARAIGTNTVAAMQSGTFFGYVDMVEGLVKRMKAELGGAAVVVATGGLASMVAPESKVIEHVDPELTLRGLRLWWERQPQMQLDPPITKR